MPEVIVARDVGTHQVGRGGFEVAFECHHMGNAFVADRRPLKLPSGDGPSELKWAVVDVLHRAGRGQAAAVAPRHVPGLLVARRGPKVASRAGGDAGSVGSRSQRVRRANPIHA